MNDNNDDANCICGHTLQDHLDRARARCLIEGCPCDCYDENEEPA